MCYNVLMNKLSVLLVVILLFVAGCARYIDKTAADISHNIPEYIKNSDILEQIDGDDVFADNDPIQNMFYMFDDQNLRLIMTTALKNNPDVLSVASRIRQARSEALIAGAELFPTVSIGADYSYTGNNSSSTGSTSKSNLNLSATFSWELDIFGRIDSEKKAASERVYAAENELVAARVSLLSDAAVYYFSIRSSAIRLNVYKKITENYNELLKVYRQQLEFGFVEASEVMKAENDFLNAYNSMKNLEVELEKNKNALLVLTGGNDIGFDVFSEYTMPVPRLPHIESISAEAILNRPDVKVSINNYTAELYRTLGSRGALYPSVRISGSLGQIVASSTGVGDLVWQIAGSISAPLLNRKELYESLNIQEESEKQARYTLTKTINTALSEIEDSVFQAGASENILANSRYVYNNTSETMTFIEGKYEYGLADIVEMLKSRNEVLNTKLSLYTSEYNNIVSSINLYKALGGAFGKPIKTVENGIDY